MKLQNITIKNIKSFRDKQTIEFRDDLNLFIGSNASGKSNLMDIIYVVIGYYFVYLWEFGAAMTKNEGAYSFVMADNIHNGRNNFEPIETFLDKNDATKKEEQLIKVSFGVTDSDIKSLALIKKYKSELEKIERSKFGSEHIQKIDLEGVESKDFKGKTFEYVIVNDNPIAGRDQKLADVFLQYLHCYKLIRFCANKYDENISDKYRIGNIPPIFQYLPSSRKTIALDGATLSERYTPLHRTAGESIVFSLGKQGELNKSEDKRNVICKKEYEDLLKDTIKSLGYHSIRVRENDDENGYELAMKKDDHQKHFSRASSGELQILNFLFSAIINRLDGGIIMIGEPELHLYPQRQRVILDLFRSLSKLFDTQFIIATHSPWMINGQSIRKTFRVYKEAGTSKIYFPHTSLMDESNTKDLVLIINALNNEKMFFSEKVILVEGIADRIIFERVLHNLQRKNKSFESIEIIDVFGKGNLRRFKNFLAEWKIKSYVIADSDYVDDLLRDKKQKIGKNEFISKLRRSGIYILPKGDMEDYFHEGHFNIDGAINVAQQIENGNRTIPSEFLEIFKEIIVS